MASFQQAALLASTTSTISLPFYLPPRRAAHILLTVSCKNTLSSRSQPVMLATHRQRRPLSASVAPPPLQEGAENEQNLQLSEMKQRAENEQSFEDSPAGEPACSPALMQKLIDFLEEDLPHLFDERGITKEQYESRVDFRDPITRYSSVDGYLFNIQMLRYLFSPKFELHSVKQLTPERPEDHNIDLIPGSATPNKPPYRVSAAQQEEIMTQVNELLQKGQPLLIPTAPWESIGMDFIFGLPKTSSENEGIWTIVDRFSKQEHFIPVRKQIMGEQMAKIFLVTVFKYHGMPKSIVSDSDPRMTGLFWRALWQNLHSTLQLSSSYHPQPQTDGQSEIVNSAVLDLLKCYVSDNPAQWEHYLPLVEFAYNNTIHSFIGKAPFEIVGARKPPPMVKAIQKAQEQQKKAADKHRRRLHFREGDWVLLRFEKARLRKEKGKEKCYPKLQMRYYGPFQISEVINDVSYRLSLPASWKIHNAFHVSLLRQFVGELPDQPKDSPQPEVDELDEVLQPEQILAHKERRQGGRLVRIYLVKYKNYSAMDSKWMEEADLADMLQILELYLEAFSLQPTIIGAQKGISQ
ncbi:hypothetical protein L7F22_016778 [Adiantum nelumboides]|nr:hypothetical protein [Adiantum nelumboides]